MSHRRELTSILRALRSRGCEVEQGRKHFNVRLGSRLVCVISVSPSDGNFGRQVERDLRRAGVLQQGERLI